MLKTTKTNQNKQQPKQIDKDGEYKESSSV